ncbi:MAG: porin [Nitrospirae bacterium]|nr:porin [Nitrospirota bacterium]
MKMSFHVMSVFLFLSLLLPLTGRAEDAPAAPAPPFTINGFVDTYYGYNFNKPKSMLNGPGTNFDFSTNTFGLSLAELVVSKAAEPVGFRMDFDYGPTTDFVHCSVVNCPPGAAEATYKNIQQAYVTWVTPLKVTLDMGKFVTHLGAEVIESKDNWNYTRSLLFCCAIPYYHSGVRANYPINDMFFVNGYVLNGWNNVIENNAMKTFGAQIGITPIKQLPIILNWIGPEEVIGTFTNKQVYDAIVTYNATDALSFMVNYDYGSQKDQTAPSQKTLKYSGTAIYARWKVDPYAVALRYEMVNDKDNLMFLGATPNGNKVRELTVTAEHTVAKSLLTRLEYRMDKSDDKIYEYKDSNTNPLTNPKDSQSRVVLSAVYMF